MVELIWGRSRWPSEEFLGYMGQSMFVDEVPYRCKNFRSVVFRPSNQLTPAGLWTFDGKVRQSSIHFLKSLVPLLGRGKLAEALQFAPTKRWHQAFGEWTHRIARPQLLDDTIGELLTDFCYLGAHRNILRNVCDGRAEKRVRWS